jgi:ABC-2 type transport system permease protein
MEKILMAILRSMRPLLGRGDVDFDQMLVIVETKLRMDKRRVYMNWRNSQQKENSNQLNRVLFFYFFMGVLMGSLLYVVDNFLTAMVFLHAYFLFMMAMTLITDFSSVLLDTTDNQVILPRPVGSRTLFAARMVHILLYLLQFTIAIALGGWFFAFLKYGIVVGIVFMATSILTVLLAVFLTYFLYLAILRFSSEQRMKDIITYFQIGMTIFFTLGFQLFPRMINMVDIRDAVAFHGWAFALPPVWMALANEAFLVPVFDPLHLTMIALAVVVPVAAFWLLNRYLAPVFARKLAALQGNAGSEGRTWVDGRHASATLSGIFSKWFCATPQEQGSFEATWKITGRDKGFRMQFYPGLAYMLVFFFVFVLRGKGEIMDNWRNLPATNNFLWLIYLPMMSISSGITLSAFNEHFNASWIYHSSPVAMPGEIISGSAKTILVKFFLPVYAIMCGISLGVWGPSVADDLLFGFFNNLACFFVFLNVTDHYLPFSRQPNVRQQSGRFAKAILQLLLVAILVGLHYLLIGKSWLLLALVPVLAGASYFLIRRVQAFPWGTIKI